jgi:hypothetical protein
MGMTNPIMLAGMNVAGKFSSLFALLHFHLLIPALRSASSHSPLVLYHPLLRLSENSWFVFLLLPLLRPFFFSFLIFLCLVSHLPGPELATAVSNAGGLGVIGGVFYTPEFLKEQIGHLKKNLKDKNAPFGIDLLLPQVGGSARKTNKVETCLFVPALSHLSFSVATSY